MGSSQSDLFTHAASKSEIGVPLAERLRPKTLRDVVGQPHLIGPEGVLTQLLARQSLPSCILWGPPGCGKTTLAQLLSAALNARFVALSAVTGGVRELREALDGAERHRAYHQQRTLVFIDEIHRFHRGQQDALLPAVERGVVIFVGATTENPQVTVNRALMSRCRLFALRAMDDATMQTRIRAGVMAMVGEKDARFAVEADAMDRLVRLSDGDVRRALGMVEMAVPLAQSQGDHALRRAHIDATLQPTTLGHTRQGEAHYDLTSALIKSMRRSDVTASVYYLARLLEAGEDVAFVGRRLMIFASEDIGVAQSAFLPLAVAAHQAAVAVGMPEAKLPLTHAVMALAQAKKSRRVTEAYAKAKDAVHGFGALVPPEALLNRVGAGFCDKQENSEAGALPEGVMIEPL